MDLIVDFPQTRASYASPQKHERRVSFGYQSEIKFVENLARSKHRGDIWFSRDEMDFFKYQTAVTMRTITSTMTMAEYAELHVKDTSAFLGLEHYLTENTYRGVKHRRNEIVVAVLSEQHRQYCSGIDDSNALTRVSRAVSDISTKRAHIIGMIHAKKN